MNNYNINQDFIILIMNCKKYTYKAEIQKKTWLTNIQYSYYHVIGDPELKHNHFFDNQERILWVKTGDDYNSLPKKVISAYAAVNSTFNYKDCLILINRVKKLNFKNNSSLRTQKYKIRGQKYE